MSEAFAHIRADLEHYLVQISAVVAVTAGYGVALLLLSVAWHAPAWWAAVGMAGATSVVLGGLCAARAQGAQRALRELAKAEHGRYRAAPPQSNDLYSLLAVPAPSGNASRAGSDALSVALLAPDLGAAPSGSADVPPQVTPGHADADRWTR